MDFVNEKLAEWRKRQAEYERDGNTVGAGIYRRVIDDLESAQSTHNDHELTLAEAVDYTGYSDDALRNMKNDGRIPDFRRRNLPRKPGHGIERNDVDAQRQKRRSIADEINADVAAAGGRGR